MKVKIFLFSVLLIALPVIMTCIFYGILWKIRNVKLWVRANNNWDYLSNNIKKTFIWGALMMFMIFPYILLN